MSLSLLILFLRLLLLYDNYCYCMVFLLSLVVVANANMAIIANPAIVLLLLLLLLFLLLLLPLPGLLLPFPGLLLPSLLLSLLCGCWDEGNSRQGVSLFASSLQTRYVKNVRLNEVLFLARSQKIASHSSFWRSKRVKTTTTLYYSGILLAR